MELLTFAELADVLKIAPDTLKVTYREWGVPAIKVGRSVRFIRADVDEWLHTRYVAN